MSKNTIMFEGFKDSQLNKKEALVEIYNALTERGYNAIDQIVGYLTSGDPSYRCRQQNSGGRGKRPSWRYRDRCDHH